MKQPVHLGVNVDQVAALRQIRHSRYPDPVHAALQAELAGADSISMHLHADRQYIQDHDIERFAASAQTKLNLQISATSEMRTIALRIKPRDVCLVAEAIEQGTARIGYDVVANRKALSEYVNGFQEAGIQTSIFIDPDERQIEATARVGAPVIELNTIHYSAAKTAIQRSTELARLLSASDYAFSLGLLVNAGHGLHYDNVQSVAEIETISEINVGHSVISRSLYWGIPMAVSKMKRLMVEARHR